MSNFSNPFVSVIIPVFNDSKRLKTCLEALEKQTYPKNLYEVIVVDNGSDEIIEKVVGQFKQAFASYESQPGSYAARNKGISLAKGKVIAFTDSDCIPAQNWLEIGVKHLLSVPNCGLIGGEIEIFFKDPSHPTAIELYDSVVFLQQKRLIEEEKYGATANVLTFKNIFEDVGLFNDRLKSGGDKEWGQRVFARGYLLVYAVDSKVKHPARNSLEQIYAKATRISGGIYELDKLYNKNSTNSLPTQLMKTLFVDLRPPLRSAFHKFYLDKRLKNKQQKTQAFTVALIVHYFKCFEKIRIQLGGSSRR
ncbi:glycosyltransferase [Gloeocapsopsis dulcis]|uniref:Glycosyl transferase family 2 n=1 Tax=Gloeocapsopsis dulcis AAB1 = 1H9 TaxID=1433147 RepID=A0A6N8FRD8_9CHRO|nr:glycosyltransferase family A protein [Gloeocapsopsis dulcis]MUL35710.1 glycosyl transferase family 2 [Gloeocapsopsis dulcis AAB1 = 1H9]WNN91007.1 glycosyltransferase family A protein [Gloeocapsopsis dulcis]